MNECNEVTKLISMSVNGNIFANNLAVNWFDVPICIANKFVKIAKIRRDKWHYNLIILLKHEQIYFLSSDHFVQTFTKPIRKQEIIHLNTTQSNWTRESCVYPRCTLQGNTYQNCR